VELVDETKTELFFGDIKPTLYWFNNILLYT
jgi:hypothetical protein